MAIFASFFGTILAFMGSFSAALNQPQVMESFSPQTAIVQNIIASAESVKAITQVALLTPDLLPTVLVKDARPTSTPSVATTTPAAAPSLHASAHRASPVPASETSTPASTQTAIAATVTAQSFLNATTLSLTENRDGPYEVHLTTDLGAGENVSWNLPQTTVGGSAGIPSFSSAYTCAPQPTVALQGATDQNPTFNPRTSYTCTISLTPLAGADVRTQSKQFTFTTPAGQLMVMLPPSIDTLLADSGNSGGFLFNNEDTQPVTVNDLTLNVSYTGLSTLYGPLVLRIVNPETGSSMGDYHLESFPAVAGQQFTFAQTGMTVPVSLTISANDEKLLPIELLGVHTMSVAGVNPSITVMLSGVTTNEGSTSTVINNATLTWSCIVTFDAYDPNATSGPIATGQACNVGAAN